MPTSTLETPEVPARITSGTTSSSNSNNRNTAFLPGELARGGAPRPASEPLSDETMRTLKRMRLEELREVSKVATALERTKVEEREKKVKADKQKVAAFVAKTDNFVELVEDCHICLEPLLNNIGTTKFGVLSWRCRCTVVQKAHSGCVFSKVCHNQGKCDMCHSPMKFVKSRRRGLKATITFHRDAVPEDGGELSSGNSGDDD